MDAEVKALTDAAYRQARQILEAKRPTLVRIAEHLQQVETIDGTELDALLATSGAMSGTPVVAKMPVEESGRGAQVAAASAESGAK